MKQKEMNGMDTLDLGMILAATKASDMPPRRWLCRFGAITIGCPLVRVSSPFKAYNALKKRKQRELDERMSALRKYSDFM